MANKKKPFVTFETKEEFDKFWDKNIKEIRKYERAEGFHDGSVWILSYILELMQDMFKPEAFAEAEKEIRDRHIEQWRKNNESADTFAYTLKAKLDKKKILELTNEES